MGNPDRKSPIFSKGDRVRLTHKPDHPREILNIEWHRERSERVYYIEHFKRPDDKNNPAYWFEDQIVLAD